MKGKQALLWTLIAVLLFLVILIVFKDSLCAFAERARSKMSCEPCDNLEIRTMSDLRNVDNINYANHDVEGQTLEMHPVDRQDKFDVAAHDDISYADAEDDSLNNPGRLRNKLSHTVTADYRDFMTNNALEGSVFQNHNKYVRTIKRHSLVPKQRVFRQEPNDWFSSNFVGIRRPKCPRIRPGARQVPDIDVANYDNDDVGGIQCRQKKALWV